MKVVRIAVICVLCLIKLDLSLADSYQKSPSENPSIRKNQDHSKNEIPHDEMKPKYDDLHHYYLPMQTTFGSYLDPSVYGGSITSPPHITPASVQNSYDQISSSVVEQGHFVNDDSVVTSYMSQCITETPSSEKPESVAILSSKQFIPENHVLSGHTEIISKTSNEEDASGIPEIVSDSSVLYQRTHIYMSSITDL